METTTMINSRGVLVCCRGKNHKTKTSKESGGTSKSSTFIEAMKKLIIKIL